MIRPTFLAFETAKRAITVSQAGLDTVGHNISNTNTPGYTRQRTDQVSLSLNAWTERYQIYGTPVPGLGSDVIGISQIRDPYLDNRYRTEATNNGELGVKADGLLDITNIFDEIMTEGLHYKMGELINAIDIFSQEADSEELAMVVRNMANEMARMLNKNASQLEDVRTQTISDVTSIVNDKVNSIVEKIAVLNKQIRQDNFYGNPSNELNDERNLLIDELAEYIDIKVVRTPQDVAGVPVEYVSIEINNSGDPSATPPVPNVKLVEGSKYNHLKVSEITADNAARGQYAGNIKIALVDNYSGREIDITRKGPPDGNGDLTQKLYKGALKGYIDILNGKGPGAPAGDSSYRGIPYYQKSLDEFAQQLAQVFNRINNISEAEAAASAGESGQPPQLSATVDKNLFVPNMLNFTPVAGSGGSSKWMDSIIAGSKQFSEGDYGMTFNYDDITGVITAKVTGKELNPDGTPKVITYEGQYQANGEVKFYEVNPDPAAPASERLMSQVAFTVKTTSEKPDAGTDAEITLDAKITAKNIAVSSSWFEDPLYITTSKLNSVTRAKPELTLSGNNNPAWLRSVAYADVPPNEGAPTPPEDFNVPNGTYNFSYDDTSKLISVTINGIAYSATYSANSTLYLRENNNPDNPAGLVITTNNKVPEPDNAGATHPSNTATIKNITGAASDNILKLKTEMRSDYYYNNSGVSADFQGFLLAFQTEMASDESYNQTMLQTSINVISDYADRRDSVSAVSLDEEAANMMTYQNHYNAAARYMTALDEALDKIINGMGRVGI